MLTAGPGPGCCQQGLVARPVLAYSPAGAGPGPAGPAGPAGLATFVTCVEGFIQLISSPQLFISTLLLAMHCGWDLMYCHEINALGIEKTLPSENLFLYPNYPNPFNASTNIKIFQSDPRAAELFIYDIRGSVVFSNKLERFSGTNIINWNASEQPSGLYFIKLRNNVFSKTQKAILVK